MTAGPTLRHWAQGPSPYRYYDISDEGKRMGQFRYRGGHCMWQQELREKRMSTMS